MTEKELHYAGGRLKFGELGSGTSYDLTQEFTPGTDTLATDASLVSFLQVIVNYFAYAVAPLSGLYTATADGLTTGAIPSTITHPILNVDFPTNNYLAVVTSANADHIITIPEVSIGSTLTLINGATGYEIRMAGDTAGINNGTPGAGAESAIPASRIVRLQRVSATNWIGQNFTYVGVVSVTEASAV